MPEGDFDKDIAPSQQGQTLDTDKEVDSPDYSTLSKIVRDAGAFHSLSLASFQMHADSSEYIPTIESFKNSLNYICDFCVIDYFTDDEVEELWIGGINFAEFYLMSKELFQSLHRTLNSEFEGTYTEDVDTFEHDKVISRS